MNKHFINKLYNYSILLIDSICALSRNANNIGIDINLYNLLLMFGELAWFIIACEIEIWIVLDKKNYILIIFYVEIYFKIFGFPLQLIDIVAFVKMFSNYFRG